MIRKIFKSIGLYFRNIRIKNCKHGFEIKDVMNTKIDPVCKICGRTLSELSKH